VPLELPLSDMTSQESLSCVSHFFSECRLEPSANIFNRKLIQRLLGWNGDGNVYESADFIVLLKPLNKKICHSLCEWSW